jgi:hypothetical protein
LFAVKLVAPVPPLATGKVPVAWFTGTDVQFVNVPEEGVPRAPPETRPAVVCVVASLNVSVVLLIDTGIIDSLSCC